VAVAEVVGDASELLALDMEQFLRRRHDLELAPVGRGDAVAATQHPAARQDERYLLAAVEPRAQTALLS
jgi:hypothetical protein